MKHFSSLSTQGGPYNKLVQDHIDKLFKALQTFFHPSNFGKWNVSMLITICCVPEIIFE